MPVPDGFLPRRRRIDRSERQRCLDELLPHAAREGVAVGVHGDGIVDDRRGLFAPCRDGRRLAAGRGRGQPAPEEVGETVAAVGSGLAPYQPRQRYLLIDEHALRAEDLPPGNVVSAQITLEQGSVAALPPVLRDLGRLLAGPRHASLRRGFAEWARQVVERSDTAPAPSGLAGAIEALEEKEDLEAIASLLAERLDEYLKAKIETGIKEGLNDIGVNVRKAIREEGIESMERLDEIVEQRLEALARQRREESLTALLDAGWRQERALLLRQTARKFDAETAEHLARLLGHRDAPDRLGRSAIR